MEVISRKCSGSIGMEIDLYLVARLLFCWGNKLVMPFMSNVIFQWFRQVFVS